MLVLAVVSVAIQHSAGQRAAPAARPLGQEDGTGPGGGLAARPPAGLDACLIQMSVESSAGGPAEGRAESPATRTPPPTPSPTPSPTGSPTEGRAPPTTLSPTGSPTPSPTPSPTEGQAPPTTLSPTGSPTPNPTEVQTYQYQYSYDLHPDFPPGASCGGSFDTVRKFLAPPEPTLENCFDTAFNDNDCGDVFYFGFHSSDGRAVCRCVRVGATCDGDMGDGTWVTNVYKINFDPNATASSTASPTSSPTSYPTPYPTPSPTPPPTPQPTHTPGVPCACLQNACFEAYDRNGDECLSLDECALQAPLTLCDSPEWDLDGDGCVNKTEEWDHVYSMTNGTVCPTGNISDEIKTCPEGYYLSGNPTTCVQCTQGSTRRRRSFECTACEYGHFDAGDFDDCVCQSEVYLSDTVTPNGSTSFLLSSVGNLAVGDNVTIAERSGREGDPAVDCEVEDCTPIYETVVIEHIQGLLVTVTTPLQNTYPKFSRVVVTCTTQDGTQISFKHAQTCGGESECGCHGETCDITEMCQASDNGTARCISVGPYPIFPTPAPTVGARGDPHLVNLQGEHFDINHGGEFTLLRIPQETTKRAEIQLKATVQPEFEKPCTTYITQVEFTGSWLDNASVQVRSYLRARPGHGEGAFLGARVLSPFEVDPPWEAIEAFLADEPELTLSAPEAVVEVKVSKTEWFPKKSATPGAPTVAGMVALSVRDTRSTQGTRIAVRQDLPEQEHLNLAVQHVSALGRADVGGLLGFDTHPESLEYVSGKCEHHRANNKLRVESQDDQDNGYYFRPLWRDRWKQIKQKRGTSSAEREGDNEAAASLVRGEDAGASLMCKCPITGDPFAEGIVVEQTAALFGSASWD